MKLFKQIWDYIFEIFMWFLLIWLCAISISYACILYKQGIISVIFAVIFTFANKIYNKIKKSEDE